MHLPSSAIPEHEAVMQGYRPLTIQYVLPKQRAMLDNIQRDLDQGGIDYVLVGDKDSPEVWRRNMKVDVRERDLEFGRRL